MSVSIGNFQPELVKSLRYCFLYYPYAYTAPVVKFSALIALAKNAAIFRRMVAIMVTFTLGITLVPAQAVPQEVLELYDPAIVRDFHLTFEPLSGWEPEESELPDGWNDWDLVEKDDYIKSQPDLLEQAISAAWDTVRFDTTNTIVVKALFYERLNGEDQLPLVVGVRRKSSRALPNENDPQKIGMKVRFSHFVPGQRWRGVNQLSLENGGDVSPLYEGMAWQLHQAASTSGFYGSNYNPALAAWATVTVNGSMLGIYSSVEQRNKRFLQNRSLWTNGKTWFYEQDDIGMPELDEGPDPLADGTVIHSPTFESLCFRPFRPASGSYAATCPTPTDGLLDETLDSQIRMQEFLTQAAIDAFTTNDDALMKGKNYNFVDRTGELRRYYPWDLDSVFRSTGNNIYSSGSTSNRRGMINYTQTEWQTLILNHPGYRVRYNAIMLQLLNGPLSTASIDALFDRVRPAVSAAMKADPYLNYVVSGSVDDHFAQLRAWIATRDSEVRKQVSANAPAPRKADSTSPTVSGLTLSTTSTTPKSEIEVRATVSDNAEVLGAEVRIASGDWIALDAVDGSFGSPTEQVVGKIFAPDLDGSYQICVRGIDSSANTSALTCTTLNVSSPKTATSLTYTGQSTVKTGATFNLAATLVDTVNQSVSGVNVTFVFTGKSYLAQTNDSGVAQVSVKAPPKIGTYRVDISSAVTEAYESSSAVGNISVIK